MGLWYSLRITNFGGFLPKGGEQGVGSGFLLFLMCSQWVPSMSQSSQCVPNGTSLSLISFALSSALVILYKLPKGQETTIYLLWDCSKVDFLFYYYYFLWCPSQKKENWIVGCPQLISIYESHDIVGPSLVRHWLTRAPLCFAIPTTIKSWKKKFILQKIKFHLNENIQQHCRWVELNWIEI